MIAWSKTSAQETVSSYGHLSLGLELISTTGAGVELAAPLGSHFALRGGFSLLPYTYKTTFGVNVDESIINEIDDALNAHPATVAELAQMGLPTRAEDVNTDVNLTASLNLANGKFLFDYYPWARYSFHLTGGVYIGSSRLVKLEGAMAQVNEFLNVLKTNGLKDNDGIDFVDKTYIIDEEKGYQLSGNDLKDMTVALKINSVKPYFGLGFGRATPKSRVGVSFEIGAFYQGTPQIVSENKNIQKLIDGELDDVTKAMKYLSVYPVVSLKLNIRLF